MRPRSDGGPSTAVLWLAMLVVTIGSVAAFAVEFLSWADLRTANFEPRQLTAMVPLIVVSVVLMWLVATWRESARRARRQAHRAEERLDALTTDAPDVMQYEADSAGRMTYVSPASRSLLGLDRQELLGRSVDDLLSDSLGSILPRQSDGVLTRKGVWVDPDGKPRALQVTIERLPPGGSVAFRGITRDIRERVAAASALRKTEQSFLAMLESAQNGILVVSVSGRILLFNRAICEILGFEPERLRDGTLDQLMPDASGGSLMSLVTAQVWGRSLERGRYVTEVTRPDGDVRHLEVSISTYPLGNGERSGWLEVSDITERRRATDRIQQIADYDHLTGLPNRQLMERSIAEVLEQARIRHRSFAVMLMDLDRFKLVNDSMGHTIGDELLQQVAVRFVEALPETHMVSRFGGDEFLVLVPSFEEAETPMRAADALIQSLNSPVEVAGRLLHIATSVGVAVYPHDGEDAATLIRRADSAMYQAKDLGGAGYQFATASLDADSHHRLNVENDLRAAIEAGELTVYYHPEVHIETGSIANFEALVRWEHPEHGLLPPAAFIPILEENGLIRLLDEWVFREACKQSERWRAARLGPVIVSVNLSARLFSNEDMLNMIRSVVAETGVNPELLEIEVTETAALRDVQDAVAILKQISDLGLRTALDDFGTGHSSLVRLKEFPLDTLKIDGSFVENMTTDEDAGSIVGGVIALGHALGLTVVAEGVEHERQLSMLRHLGCDLAQGYLFARPLTAAAATTLLSEHGRLGYGFAA